MAEFPCDTFTYISLPQVGSKCRQDGEQGQMQGPRAKKPALVSFWWELVVRERTWL